MNRIGDFFLLIGICLSIKIFKSTNLGVLEALAPYFQHQVILFSPGTKISSLVCITGCFMIAVISKSAQLGLHT